MGRLPCPPPAQCPEVWGWRNLHRPWSRRPAFEATTRPRSHLTRELPGTPQEYIFLNELKSILYQVSSVFP